MTSFPIIRWPACVRIIALLALSRILSAPLVPGQERRAAPQPTAANSFLKAGEVDLGWPTVRGPRWDGHSAEVHLAETWPSGGPPVLWVRDLGQGYSAFVCGNQRVYTQYQTLGGQYVVCLDGDTGKTIWEHRYDWPYELAGVYPGPRATPTLAQGRLYFATPSGVVGCLEATTGQLVWSRDLIREYAGTGTDFGYACSPTIVDDLVVMPVGGKNASLVALDAKTGATVWTAGDDPASYTPAFPITLGNRSVVIGYLQNALIACDVRTGERLWRRQLSTGYDEHSAWPLYREPQLWISGPFRGGCELLDLSNPSPRTVWHNTRMSNDILSSVLVDGNLYGFDVADAQAKTQRPTRGHFRCLDFLTGEERWSNAALQYRTDTALTGTPRIGHATVLVADGKLFLLNDTGELILAAANPERYEERSRAMLLGGEIVWTPPALHRGRLYLRNHSRAVCVYVGRVDLLRPEVRSQALALRDVPQTAYQDWAGEILGIEPEYAFDVPSAHWLVRWFWWSVAAIWLPACLVGWMVGFAVRDRDRQRTLRLATARCVAFVLGALGTSLISRWVGDFVFTWPVCLLVMFSAAFDTISWGRPGPALTAGPTRGRAYTTVALLLTVCVAYFLVCRRLSLVFEWTFLAGFVGAVPPLLVNRWWQCRAASTVVSFLAEGVAFAGFYACSVAVLWLKAG